VGGSSEHIRSGNRSAAKELGKHMLTASGLHYPAEAPITALGEHKYIKRQAAALTRL
jgi:hypothetical protein